MKRFLSDNIKNNLISYRAIILIALSLVFISFLWAYKIYNLSNNSKKQALYLNNISDLNDADFDEQIKDIEEQIITFSKNRMVIQAFREFGGSFKEISGLNIGTENEHNNKSSPSENNISSFQYAGHLIDLIEHNNISPASQILNIALNEYSKVYKKYHPILKAYSDKFGYIDITLIDPETYYVIYSSKTESYFGKSIKSENINTTNFANTALRVKLHGYAKRITKAEFGEENKLEFYFATSVIDNNNLIGIIIFRFPVEKFNDTIRMNQLMTVGNSNKSKTISLN